MTGAVYRALAEAIVAGKFSNELNVLRKPPFSKFLNFLPKIFLSTNKRIKKASTKTRTQIKEK